MGLSAILSHLSVLSLLVGCTAAGSDPSFDTDGGGGTSADGGHGGSGGSNPTGGNGMGGGLDIGGTGGGEVVVSEVFGHSAQVLYKLDPMTSEVTVVGPFGGCTDVIDLAIDKDHALVATTFDGVYSIDKTTAACTQIRGGNYPNSLSFVPVGTLDPNVEALVGYNGSSYVRIDTATGSVTTVGSVGGGYSSSGDIVSVIGGSTYLTVYGGGCSDCLFEVNPTTGAMIKNWGPLGYDQVFGLAFWGGKAYGFTNDGDLFEIAFGATTVTTTPIAIPGAPPDLSFWGAGSATSAPLEPPQ